METVVYNGIVKNISNAFANEIRNISAVYNFDYGDEYEICICKFLRKFLPIKYGICRGFVIDQNGKTAGDDIIIYDQELYPTLRFLKVGSDFSQKEQIPIEAVYAYIEAKYTLNSQTLKKAMKQINEVKRICYSRSAVPRINVNRDIHIFNNKYSKANGWNPIISNPVYGMILAANCVGLDGKRTDNGYESQKFLMNEITALNNEIIENKHFSVDSIIAGENTTAFCGHHIFDKNGNKMNGILITRFYTGINPVASYIISEHQENAFGLGISHMMMALNFIKLGVMPWDLIFNTAKMPNKEERDAFEDLVKNSISSFD